MLPGRCPLCGPAPSRACLRTAAAPATGGPPVPFAVRACLRCGTLFCDPALEPTDCAGFYPETYGPFNESPEPPPLVRGFRAAAMAARDAVPPGMLLRRAYGALYRFIWRDYELPVPRPWGTRRALDLGCGAGDYLARLRTAGWDVTGLDPSPVAAREAARRHGLHIHPGPLDGLPPGGPPFQFATAWEVVEHLPDPVGGLNALRRRLAPDGLLMLSTPDPLSLERRLLGRYWAGYDVPRHLALFGRPQLRELLRRAGFRVVRVDVQCHVDNWVLALAAWARGPSRRPSVLREPVARFAGVHRMDAKTALLAPALVLAAFRAAGRVRVLARCADREGESG